MSDDELRALSVRLEQQTGYDSIPTIENHYVTHSRLHQDDSGFGCVFPACERRTRTAAIMWRHVHWEHQPKPFPIKFADLTPEYTP